MRRVPSRLASIFLGLALAVVAVSTPAPVSAESSSPVLSEIVKRGTLRVGMSGNQPPLNFKGKDGEMYGLEVDLARAFAAVMGLDLEIVQKPFGQLLPALESNQVDLVMSGVTITTERNLKAAFVGPYFVSGKSIITKSSTLAKADEPGDLDQSNVMLAALEGSTSQRFVEALLPKAKLTTTKDYDAAVKLLLDGKVDAVVADREIAALSALRNQDAGVVALSQPLTIEPIGIAARPGDALYLNLLQNTLGALELSDVLTALRIRWTEQGDWLTLLP
jgi:polar amino acid transport system substrate-binding protein